MALEFPNFAVTISMLQAGPLYQWFGDMLARRNSPRAGQLQLMAATQQPLATIDFTALQPMLVSAPYDGGNDNLPAVKMILSAADVRLNLRGLGV